MSSLLKCLLERTSLFTSRKTDLPRFLNPTKHFPKYQTIEATSLFFILKTQKHSSFQIVCPPKSHDGTHIVVAIEENRLAKIPKPTNHFPKYQTIEATSLFFILKTQKHSSFQIVILPKMPSGTHIVVYIEENRLAKIPKPNEKKPQLQECKYEWGYVNCRI